MRVDFTFFGRHYYARADIRATVIVNDCGEDVTGTDMLLTAATTQAVNTEVARLLYLKPLRL